MGNVFGGDETSSEESDPNSPPRSVELAIPWPDMLGVEEVVPMYWGQGSRGGESLS